MNISLQTTIPGTSVLEGAGATVSTDATLTGDGSAGNPLGINAPVAINKGGTSAATAAAALAALGGVGAGRVITKVGTNAGDYTTNAGSFVAIGSTNLDIAVVVPVGSIAVAILMGSGKSGSGTTFSMGIAVDGTIPGAACQIGGGVGNNGPVPACAIATKVGDGASHTFEPQWKNFGAAAITLLNSGNFVSPMHVVIVLAAT